MRVRAYGVICMTLALWCTAVAAQSGETVLVGIKEAPPFAIKAADGSWEGISVALWRRVAEYRELELESLLDEVESGRIDIAVGALTVTPARERVMDFSHPFYTTGLAIATTRRGGNPWLGVARGVVSAEFLKAVGALLAVLLAVGALIWWVERGRNTGQFNRDPVRGRC